MSNEQYMAVCKERFDKIEEAVKESNSEVLDKLDAIDKKLFHDNGTECLQSKINRHENFQGNCKWVIFAIAILVIESGYRIVGSVISHIWAK